uniref:guanylate cyclase n=1 Tax=Schmidtea mediterranea TaxID=79327 RepID=A0A5P8I4I8_SCHMD|nr:gucy1b2 protein [Schmidtea mediterranea]
MNIMYSRMLPTIPKALSIGPKDFCELFPYHFVFDQAMLLKQSGIQIQAIIPDFRRINVDIRKYLQLIHPTHEQFTFESVENLLCSPHVMKVIDNKLTTTANQDDEIYLRGQMIKLMENQCILFMCSPMVSSLNDIERKGMKMSEIPNHDVTKYFCSFQTIGKGDWSDKFLGRDNNTSGEDNSDVETYDHFATLAGASTMSGLINNSLREGRKYKNCYILFCDIVHFSTIVTSSGPNEVLDMLNNIHNEFDRLTRVHDVQKIDSVGDAYLIVSGILDHINQRSERIANIALAMILISKTIKSPYDYGSNFGKRALIRIGLNCGEIIGGIIGSANPKFTVMGDSVVTASKMESHGIPDRIHITAAMYRELASSHYDMEERGCIEIRGKGRQFTYFLNRNLDVSDNALLGKTRDAVYSKK